MKTLAELNEKFQSKFSDFKCYEYPETHFGCNSETKRIRFEAKFYKGYCNKMFPLHECHFYLRGNTIGQLEIVKESTYINGVMIPTKWEFQPICDLEKYLTDLLNQWNA